MGSASASTFASASASSQPHPQLLLHARAHPRPHSDQVGTRGSHQCSSARLCTRSARCTPPVRARPLTLTVALARPHRRPLARPHQVWCRPVEWSRQGAAVEGERCRSGRSRNSSRPRLAPFLPARSPPLLSRSRSELEGGTAPRECTTPAHPSAALQPPRPPSYPLPTVPSYPPSPPLVLGPSRCGMAYRTRLCPTEEPSCTSQGSEPPTHTCNLPPRRCTSPWSAPSSPRATSSPRSPHAHSRPSPPHY